MARALVSVIIPVFNRRQYIVEAIESVRAQTDVACELIVVDDGSTDGSAETIRSLGPGFRYLYQENQGIGGARNTGLAHATGAFLAFLDSDDVWLPCKLQRQLAIFDAHPETDAVYGHVEQFYSPEIEPEYWRTIRSRPGRLPAPLPSSLLIRRATFDRVGPFDRTLGIGVDMDWYSRFLELKPVVVMLPDVLFRRRLHRSNFGSRRLDAQSERMHVLKAVIDRRRAATLSLEKGPVS